MEKTGAPDTGQGLNRKKDEILLQLRYIHREYVEIKVDDPDKCNILDIFVELLEGAEKIGMFLPDSPTLWYAHNSQSFMLESDIDVVNMLNKLSGQMLIKLAIGEGDTPSKQLELARGLIQSKRQVDNSILQRSSYGSQPSSSRKVPATSARRKRIYTSKGRSHSLPSESTSGEVSRTMDVVIDDVLPDAELPNPKLPDVDLPSTESHDVDATDVVDGEIVSDDGENDYFDTIYANGELYGDNSFGKIKLKVWMIFVDKEAFMDVMRDYCIQEGFSIVVVKAEQRRYTAVCGESNYDWRIHVSRLADEVTWAIKSLNDTQSCLKLTTFNSMATPEWAAKKLLEHVRADEEIKGSTMQSLLMSKYGINMKSTSLYKARSLALKIIKGDEDTSYGSLPGYYEVLKTSNPDSKAHIVWRHGADDVERPLQFKSVFISLKPMIEGFIYGCRGLIGVDGCHLKGKYGGVVLSAIALDENNEIFPLAYGVYENESKSTWSSFLYQLREVLKSADRDNWCIISDRQKGVEPALTEVWPTASRRYCGTHLRANFKKAFPGKPMGDLFWSCCKAFSYFKFQKAMERVERVAGAKAVTWLQRVGELERWARHRYDPNLHSPDTSSNFVESFNSILGADRCLPVLALLDGIRRTLMVRHCKRQEDAQNMPQHGITDCAKKKLAKALEDSRNLKVFKASPTEFEVTEGRSSLAVNIANQTCGCEEWKLRGIPCRHGVRAIHEIRGHPEHHVFEWYSVIMYKRTYSVNYRAVPDEEQWPPFDLPRINPPNMKRGVGTPARIRRRQEGQAPPGKRSRLVRCGRCQAYGHNVKTCKGGLTAKEAKEHQSIRVERRLKKKKTKETNKDEQHQSVVDVVSSAPWMPGSQ